MSNQTEIGPALEHFQNILEDQLERVEKLKIGGDWINYEKISPLKIGVIGGDGIGPIICREARRVLGYILEDSLSNGLISFEVIEGRGPLAKY